MSTSDTQKALMLINDMTAEKMRLVLILLAARLPFSVIAATNDIPNGDVGIEPWPKYQAPTGRDTTEYGLPLTDAIDRSDMIQIVQKWAETL